MKRVDFHTEVPTTLRIAMPAVSSPSLRIALFGASVSAALLAPMASAHAEAMIGLANGQQLFTFDSATPGTSSALVPITGLQGGASLVGIDLRPSTGVLYGVAGNGTLYTLNATTGAASFIGSLSTGPLSGGRVGGIDFNPVPDLAGNASLRITDITAVNNNLRVNVNPGLIGQTIVDGNLTLNGVSTGLSSIAYAMNDRDPATGTALYGINSGNLYRVTDPNAGTLALVGSLGVATTGLDGFDISGLTGASFAALSNSTNSGSSFYTINLSTGAASLVGVFSQTVGLVQDVTAATQAPQVSAVPEPETYAMMLLGLAGMGWVARRRRR